MLNNKTILKTRGPLGILKCILTDKEKAEVKEQFKQYNLDRNQYIISDSPMEFQSIQLPSYKKCDSCGASGIQYTECEYCGQIIIN